MFTDDSVDDLYDIIVSQASTQLNLKTNKSESIEMIKAEGEIKDNCAPNEENIEKIFQSISSILKTRLTVINLSSNNCSNYESDNCHNEAPIYVCTTNQPLSFSLPIFRKESSLKFSSLIKDPSTLKLDNIGRFHLDTPYSGISHVFVRSSKYNGTTVTSHITDIYHIISSDEDLLRSPHDYG